VKIAEATHIPKVIIGATIVSAATTLPEFSVSAIATVRNITDMAIGNAIGSCICNIGLILGTCTIARASATDKRLLTEQGGFMIGAGILIFLLTLGGGLERWGGAILIMGLIAYMYYSVRTAKSRRDKAMIEMRVDEEDADFPMQPPTLTKEVLLFLMGAVCVVAGSYLLVKTGVKLARLIGVSEMVISLSLIALGTSLPEYVTAFTATIKGHQELSIGNIIGANILNVFWVLGGCSLIRPLKLNPGLPFLGFPQTQSLDLPVMFLLMVLLIGFGFSKGELKKWQGGVLFSIYAVYLFVLFAVVKSP